MGGDSLDIVIDMWREEDLEIVFSSFVGLARGMKLQVKVEYGKDKFVKFYVEADVVDGIVLNYSFSSLVEDIRRTCGSLRHHTSSTLRVRYKDEDGDFVNLNEDDTDNFQEMFVLASSVDEGLYRKIILRVSELEREGLKKYHPLQGILNISLILAH